ncbi:hypothetical protein BsWGS_17028 [Bradybaena similaris]
MAPSMNIAHLEANIGTDLVEIDEKSWDVFKYKTPSFTTVYSYPSEATIICDSDGTDHPWYPGKFSSVVFRGPSDRIQSASIAMSFSIQAKIAWYSPLNGLDHTHKLTKVARNQTFILWIAAVNHRTKELIVLKTMKWRVTLTILINPYKPKGQRSTVVSMPAWDQKIIMDYVLPIPEEVLRPRETGFGPFVTWIPARGKAINIDRVRK